MRVHNIGKWQVLPHDAALPFRGGEIRVIDIKVNCPTETLFFWQEDGVETFLAPVKGMATIELEAGGGASCALRFEGESEPYFITRDGAVTAIKYDEMPATFTKIATRRQRNPDLARIEDTMRLNELRRQQQWEDEQKRRREWERANGIGNDTAEGGAAGGGSEPASEGAADVQAEGTSTDGESGS